MSNYYGQNQNNLLVKRQTDNTTPGVNAKRKKTAKIKERKVKYRAKNGIRVNSASGQVGPGQLGRVNSAGSTRPYI